MLKTITRIGNSHGLIFDAILGSAEQCDGNRRLS
jgi:hypothetical protein